MGMSRGVNEKKAKGNLDGAKEREDFAK
ncbi:uncharacterized protein G2W53_011880 [Senna tora]|uniref:Uncharacterized protein n=1 Tax=Senna tora TaxID=362788 RepID=A0A834TWU4_9FABA|nr:uncharacterized protein G2W53_011880 [Senna tora]